MTKTELSESVGEVKARLESLTENYARIQSAAAQINKDGVACERELLGVEGELKALMALESKATD